MSMYPERAANNHQHPVPLLIGNTGACARWIKALSLNDELKAHDALASQLAALEDAAVAPTERLRVLEALRETVDLLQAAVARRYVGKALPLEEEDARSWHGVVAVWNALRENYLRCFDAYRQGDVMIAPLAPLIVMRCLRALECILFEHFRIYHQPDPAVWRAFHELFSTTERLGISNIRVEDMLGGHGANPSCAEVYMQGLLLDLAGPYSLSSRQLTFVRRWIAKWSPLVGLSKQPLPLGPTPSLAVDLAGDGAATLAERVTPSSSVRYLDMEQMSRSLRQTLNLLKQGNSPGQLGLGADAHQPGCEGLIMLLFVRWCRAGSLRGEERHPTDELATLGFGIRDTWTLVSTNLPPELPKIPRSAAEKEQIDNLLSRSQDILQATSDIFEQWRVVDRSASGFMCVLRDPASTTRILHNQVLAVHFGSDKPCLIGMIQWLRVDKNEGFMCGVRLFPGVPQVVMTRISNFNPADPTKFEGALLMPEVVVPATPATVVLPAGWFENGRVIEFQYGPKDYARLRRLLDHGADFDRCTFDYI